MNIAQNLDRIEAAVNAMKLSCSQKGVGEAQNIDQVAQLVAELDSPVFSNPLYVSFDSSIYETPYMQPKSEIRLQFTDIKDGILMTGYNNLLNMYWPELQVVNGHLVYTSLWKTDPSDPESSEYGIASMTDPDVLDTNVHTWILNFDMLIKDGTIIGSITTPEMAWYQQQTHILGRALNIPIDGSNYRNNDLYQGKFRIYSISDGPELAIDGNHVTVTTRYNWYKPLAKDASTQAILVDSSTFLDWDHNNGVRINGIYGTISYAERSIFTEYQDPYDTLNINVDMDSSAYIVYTPEASFDGYSSVVFDGSVLGSQVSTIYNRLSSI